MTKVFPRYSQNFRGGAGREGLVGVGVRESREGGAAKALDLPILKFYVAIP
jgi:hypothetical protein